MSPDLKPGINFVFDYTVPDSKTVPRLYPEWREFSEMPDVFATGFLAGSLVVGVVSVGSGSVLDVSASERGMEVVDVTAGAMVGVVEGSSAAS